MSTVARAEPAAEVAQGPAAAPVSEDPRFTRAPAAAAAAAASAARTPVLYAEYFGLKREPFSIAPDPRCLYMSERHREALAHLLFGVKGGGGFVLLTGDVGTGKTTVCRCFLEQVPSDVNVAYVLNPRQSVEALLETVCQEFHVPLPPRRARLGTKDAIDALNRFLLDEHAKGRSNVLIVDEAQSLSVDVLEQLRLLTNLETAERKLLQIMLIGQPELRTMLDRPELEQLAQRVIARYHLHALAPQETARYVRHRLTVSGMGAAQPFGDAALALVHEIARGIPRRINLLCDRALLGAYAKGKSAVGTAILERAAAEVFGQPAPSALRRLHRQQNQHLWIMVGSGLLLGLAVAALSAWWLVRSGTATIAGAGVGTRAGAASAASPATASAPQRAPGSASMPVAARSPTPPAR